MKNENLKKSKRSDGEYDIGSNGKYKVLVK